MYSNKQIQKQLLDLDDEYENPAFGFRPRTQRPMPHGYTEPMYYAPPQPAYYPPIQQRPHGNGVRNLLMFLIGIAIAGFVAWNVYRGDVSIKPYVVLTPVPSVQVAPPVQNVAPQAQTQQKQQAQPAPIQAQEPVKEQQQQAPAAQPQVMPTAQIAQPTAMPIHPQVRYNGDDHRFVPTVTPVPPTHIPPTTPPYSVTMNDSGQQCIDVPTANNSMCLAKGIVMDEATQKSVAELMQAGFIHPPTEEAEITK